MSRDVVITGMGVISPSGNTLAEYQRRLWNGDVVIESIEFETDPGRTARLFGARVRDFDPALWMSDRIVDGTDVSAQYAIAAAAAAVEDAGIDDFEPRRTAVVLGTSIGGVVTLQRSQRQLDLGSVSDVQGKMMIKIFPNMAGMQIASRFGLHGPQITLCQACAAGVDAIGQAAQLVANGVVDVAIAGGYEASVGLTALAEGEFVTAMAASQLNFGMVAPTTDPLLASLPFDKRRGGVVTAEAAGIVVVESAERAAARGARSWGRVEGYATLAEAGHPSAPEPSGRWQREVMGAALLDAGRSSADIDGVIAHGTGTPKGDSSEIRALNSVFAGRSEPVAVASIKGHMGHAAGASGALAIIAAALAMRQNSMIHTAGTTELDDEIEFDAVIEKPKPMPLRRMLVNAFGFGGQDSSLVLAAAD